MPRLSEPSPYVEFDRSQWRTLRKSTPQPLTEEEVVGLRGLGEQIDLLEVEEVYLPLARLLHLQVAARQGLFAATDEFLDETRQNPDRPVPFIIGVAGSVAVGKWTTGRVVAVNHGGGRQRAGGEATPSPCVEGLAGPLGPPPAGRPGDHRRVPLSE